MGLVESTHSTAFTLFVKISHTLSVFSCISVSGLNNHIKHYYTIQTIAHDWIFFVFAMFVIQHKE